MKIRGFSSLEAKATQRLLFFQSSSVSCKKKIALAPRAASRQHAQGVEKFSASQGHSNRGRTTTRPRRVSLICVSLRVRYEVLAFSSLGLQDLRPDDTHQGDPELPEQRKRTTQITREQRGSNATRGRTSGDPRLPDSSGSSPHRPRGSNPRRRRTSQT